MKKCQNVGCRKRSQATKVSHLIIGDRPRLLVIGACTNLDRQQ